MNVYENAILIVMKVSSTSAQLFDVDKIFSK